MRRVLVGAAAVAAATFIGPVGGLDAANTVIYGPYASDSPDSGTCGNTWANDVIDRVYKVRVEPNADGSYTVRQEFKRGTFTTIEGASPGACGNGTDTTVPDGLTGSMHGYMDLVVNGGTYDPDATCALPCYTADFVTSVFGPGATRTVTSWAFFYNAGPNGNWKNASADRGGNTGDIVG